MRWVINYGMFHLGNFHTYNIHGSIIKGREPVNILPLLLTGVYSQRKTFARRGANSFLSEQTPFSPVVVAKVITVV